jgi:hypothetical protein
MFEFTASIDDLKKALSVVALATTEAAEDIHAQALFRYPKQREPVSKLYLSSTDEDRIALSQLSVTDVKTSDDLASKEIEFTADPQRLQALISNSDLKIIRFVYDPKTLTLNAYASEDSEAFISFASFDPTEFLSFEKSIDAAINVTVFNTEIFLSAIRFVQGFLPNDDKEKRFSNMFFDHGKIYGTNGSYKLAAFQCEDFSGLSNLAIRRSMLGPIVSMLDRVKSSSLKLKTSDSIVVVTSADDTYSFGFRRSTINMPKMPIQTVRPASKGFTIEPAILIKKLNRLAVASKEDVGLRLSMKEDDNELLIETETERKSREKITCQRIAGSDSIEIFNHCSKIKSVIEPFTAASVEVYLDKNTIIYSESEFSVKEDGVETKKPFIAVGLLATAKRV